MLLDWFSPCVCLVRSSAFKDGSLYGFACALTLQQSLSKSKKWVGGCTTATYWMQILYIIWIISYTFEVNFCELFILIYIKMKFCISRSSFVQMHWAARHVMFYPGGTRVPCKIESTSPMKTIKLSSTEDWANLILQLKSWESMKVMKGYLSIVSSTHTKNWEQHYQLSLFPFLFSSVKVQWDQSERPLFPLWYLLPAPSDSRVDRFSGGNYPREGYLANTLPREGRVGFKNLGESVVLACSSVSQNGHHWAIVYKHPH